MSGALTINVALLSQTLTHALFDTTGGEIMYYLGVSRHLSETILLRRPYLLFLQFIFHLYMKGIFLALTTIYDFTVSFRHFLFMLA